MGRRRKKKHYRKPDRIQRPADALEGWCDGACAGNPGPMGVGGVLRRVDETLDTFSEAAGIGTNNEAEYLAMIGVLELGLAHGASSIVCRSDSELVVCQLCGEYQVRQPHLYKLYRRASRLVEQYAGSVRFAWVPRDRNAHADALASQAVGMPQAVVSDGEIEPWQPNRDYRPDPEALAALPCSGANIRPFLAKKALRFGDFLRLKTGGMDGYSRLPVDQLKEIIALRHGAEAVDWMARALDEAEESAYGKDALRWCARGLPPDLALKKASVNLEMSNRSMSGRRRHRIKQSH